MSRGSFREPGPGSLDDGVEVAIAALSQVESQVHHAARLAAVVRDRDTEPAERVALLRRTLALDARVARQAALHVAASDEEAVRTAAAGVLGSTVGSEDDITQLQSLITEDRLAGNRATLQAAMDAVASPDPDEAVSLLLRLVRLPAGRPRVDIVTLVPAQTHRAHFITWVAKAWARAADHRQPRRFLDAARTLAAIIVDQAVLTGVHDDRDPDHLTAAEADQIAHGLRGRPRHLDLVGRTAVGGRWPWIEAYVAIETTAQAVPPRPRPPAVGALEIDTMTRHLRALVQGWLETRRQ